MAEQNHQQQDLREILQIRRDKLKALQDAGMNPFEITRYDVTHHAQEVKDHFDALEGQTVSLGGRLMSKRGMGKVSFCDLQDKSGRIQIYARKDEMDEEAYNRFKKYDIGDIVGVRGEVFRTQRGEMSVRAKKITLLSKSLRPLPEKYHGLTDKEARYRQRYVDLIVNPDVKETFRKRSIIIKTLRNALDEAGYTEVETPILQPIAGGASARPFITHHNSLDIDLYLRIATELYLKRLIVGGFEGVYEIGKNFRNEGMDKNHNPEFTCMELYVQYKDYNWMMSFTECLLERICIAVNGSAETVIDGKTISFKAPYRRLPILEAIREKTGYDLSDKNEDEIRAICKELKMEIDETMGKGKLIDEIFGEFCEGTFIQPTFITDYPIEMSPLTKKHRDNPALTERFELMVNGKELANAYSFLRALQYGMPPTSGIGIGIDRLVMLMTGQSYIQEVLLFPTMRPEKNPPRDAVSAYTAIGIPEDVVPVLQKLGYNLVSNLAEEKPQKIQQQIIELQKKYRGIVDLPRPGVEEISEWISHLHK